MAFIILHLTIKGKMYTGYRFSGHCVLFECSEAGSPVFHSDRRLHAAGIAYAAGSVARTVTDLDIEQLSVALDRRFHSDIPIFVHFYRQRTVQSSIALGRLRLCQSVFALGEISRRDQAVLIRLVRFRGDVLAVLICQSEYGVRNMLSRHVSLQDPDARTRVRGLVRPYVLVLSRLLTLLVADCIFVPVDMAAADRRSTDGGLSAVRDPLDITVSCNVPCVIRRDIVARQFDLEHMVLAERDSALQIVEEVVYLRLRGFELPDRAVYQIKGSVSLFGVNSEVYRVVAFHEVRVGPVFLYSKPPSLLVVHPDSGIVVLFYDIRDRLRRSAYLMAFVHALISVGEPHGIPLRYLVLSLFDLESRSRDQIAHLDRMVSRYLRDRT